MTEALQNYSGPQKLDTILIGILRSVFPKATGNAANKNLQGQFHLDDILTHPNNRAINDGKIGIEIYIPDGRGVYFKADGSFRGFIEKRLR